MKTLENHTIIYDDDCLMCNLYTGAFVKSGMLDKDGRIPYSSFAKDPSASVDLCRAGNEIALVNKEDQSVTYGLDSLLKIIGNSFPIFKPLFRVKFFRRVLNPVYFFVSYNRKVIVPGNAADQKISCSPSFNKKYRIAYILFAWLVTSLILSLYAPFLAPLVPGTSFNREFMVCGGQIVFQAVLVGLLQKEKLLTYLGHLMTVSLGGALLLLLMMPVLLILSSPYLFLFYFLFVAFLMLLEHIRRVKKLGLPWYISAGWVAYRIFVLFIIL